MGGILELGARASSRPGNVRRFTIIYLFPFLPQKSKRYCNEGDGSQLKEPNPSSAHASTSRRHFSFEITPDNETDTCPLCPLHLPLTTFHVPHPPREGRKIGRNTIRKEIINNQNIITRMPWRVFFPDVYLRTSAGSSDPT